MSAQAANQRAQAGLCALMGTRALPVPCVGIVQTSAGSEVLTNVQLARDCGRKMRAEDASDVRQTLTISVRCSQQ